MTTPQVAEMRELANAALSEVTLAEEALEKALSDLGSGGARADKVAMTTVVGDAFKRLRSARAELTRLRDLVVAQE